MNKKSTFLSSAATIGGSLFAVLSLLSSLAMAETPTPPNQHHGSETVQRKIIETPNAPAPVGTYSQAVEANGTVYLSGQIGLVPETMEMAGADVRTEIHQAFKNLRAVAEAAGGTFDDMVKLTIFLTNMDDFPLVSEVMSEYFQKPYPARAVVGAANLPKGARVEMEGVMTVPR